MRQEINNPCLYPFLVSISDEKPLHMRLNDIWDSTNHLFVSISDEKPLHMRLRTSSGKGKHNGSFNLRREAAPHATPKFSRIFTSLSVSISDEKPLHMRRAA